MKNTIIYLFGFPGTGKLTTAKELGKQADVILLDNQTINIPLFKAVNADGKTKLPERIWDNVKKVWDAVFDTIIHIAPQEYNYVLTNVLVNEDTEDVEWFKHVRSVAEQKQATFLPVRLTCSVQEMKKRIVRPERKERMKEMDPATPTRYAENFTVLTPDHPNLLSLDVTDLSPEETVRIILDHARNCS